MLNRFNSLLCVLSLVLLTGGCAEESASPLTADDLGHEDHDHGNSAHGHGMSLGDALEDLEDMTADIASAFAQGDTDAAHGPLHEIGHSIEAFANLADKAELSDEAKTTIETNVEALMNAFGAVDRQMHGQEGADFADVKEEIETALTAIHEAAEPALGDHDHDEHGEKGHSEAGDHDDHKDDDHGHDEEGHEKHDEKHHDTEHSEKE